MSDAKGLCSLRWLRRKHSLFRFRDSESARSANPQTDPTPTASSPALGVSDSPATPIHSIPHGANSSLDALTVQRLVRRSQAWAHRSAYLTPQLEPLQARYLPVSGLTMEAEEGPGRVMTDYEPLSLLAGWSYRF